MKKIMLILSILFGGCAQKPPKDAEQIKMSIEKSYHDDFSRKNNFWQVADGDWNFKDGFLIQQETSSSYNAIINTKEKFSNCQIEVDFMPISGRWDASGGIIFRAQDNNNYYIIRANALEDNFSLYTYINGSRSNLIEVETKAPEIKKWHTIKVVAKDSHIQGYLDGKLLIDYIDDTFKSGYVGLWTKADSVTKFDNFQVEGK